MDLYLDQLLRELPDGLSDEIRIKFYSSDKISVLRAENVFSEQRAFDCYKFLVPYSNLHPFAKIEKKKFKLEKNKFFAINPGQEHGFSVTGKVQDFNAVFIDKEYFRQIHRLLYGQSMLEFNNENNIISSNLYQLFNEFIAEYNNKQPGYEFVLQSYNIQIIVNIIREFGNNSNNKKLKLKNYQDKKIVEMAIEYINAHYKDDFTLEQLAHEVNYSPFHFIRIFKKEMGQTPFEYLQDLKIEKAKLMLRQTNKNITDICFATGFNNRSYFSSIFKKRVGVAPSEYRRICLG